MTIPRKSNTNLLCFCLQNKNGSIYAIQIFGYTKFAVNMCYSFDCFLTVVIKYLYY